MRNEGHWVRLARLFDLAGICGDRDRTLTTARESDVGTEFGQYDKRQLPGWTLAIHKQRTVDLINLADQRLSTYQLLGRKSDPLLPKP